MTLAANAWHREERVSVQARTGNLVLVQYVARRPLPKNPPHRARLSQAIHPWAWLPEEAIIMDDDIDAITRLWTTI